MPKKAPSGVFFSSECVRAPLLDTSPHARYNKDMDVYLDYAASAPLREEVLSDMLPYLKENFGNPDSLHSFGRRAAQAVTDARDRIAAVLGVKPNEVYFTSGGTEADNWAVRCIGEGNILYSPIEHAATMSAIPLRKCRLAVPCTVSPDGAVRTDSGGAVPGDLALVCVMAVNNETGCIQPFEEIGAFARRNGACFFSDCVQAAVSLDLKEILKSADAISLSAHKIGGPKGVGALVVKKGVPVVPLIAGGEQERGLRGGTLNVAGAVGFARALELAQNGRKDFCAHTEKLRDLFERKVKAALGGSAAIDGKRRVPNISHITFAGGGDAFLTLLDLNGVAASGGAACSAHASRPSHVMLAMGRSGEEAKCGVRFSFGRETTEEETLFAADAVIRTYRRFG